MKAAITKTKYFFTSRAMASEVKKPAIIENRIWQKMKIVIRHYLIALFFHFSLF